MTELPISAIVNLSDGVQYALMETGEVFRNRDQVLIAPEGVPANQVLAEIRAVFDALTTQPHSQSSLLAEFDEARKSVDPDAVPALDTTEVDDNVIHMREATYGAFDVWNPRIEDGNIKATVGMRESNHALNFTYESADAALSTLEDNLDNVYRLACAKVFQLWWQEQGLSVPKMIMPNERGFRVDTGERFLVTGVYVRDIENVDYRTAEVFAAGSTNVRGVTYYLYEPLGDDEP